MTGAAITENVINWKTVMRKVKNHPANAGGISVPSKLRLPIRLKVGCQFAFHRLTPVVCAFDVINKENFAFKKKQPAKAGHLRLIIVYHCFGDFIIGYQLFQNVRHIGKCDCVRTV